MSRQGVARIVGCPARVVEGIDGPDDLGACRNMHGVIYAESLEGLHL